MAARFEASKAFTRERLTNTGEYCKIWPVFSNCSDSLTCGGSFSISQRLWITNKVLDGENKVNYTNIISYKLKHFMMNSILITVLLWLLTGIESYKLSSNNQNSTFISIELSSFILLLILNIFPFSDLSIIIYNNYMSAIQ